MPRTPSRLGLVLAATVALVLAREPDHRLLAAPPTPPPPPDWRNIAAGNRIPGGRYCDQPYLVRTAGGAWLCVMTGADGPEGSATQNVFSLRSTDRGQTWSTPVPLEDPGGPEASYAVLLQVPSGRVYCFYNHNSDNLREVRTEDGKTLRRVDSLGHYVFRFTDDGGRTWSPRRYEVPVREFACDRRNVYGGKTRLFWNVGRPLTLRPHRGEEAVLFTIHKVGAMGAGFFAQSEGAFLRSDNILRESDPARVRFETLPDGDVGLRTPPGGGRIAEEQSVVQLDDGTLYCLYRTVDGHPVCSTSRDGGRTWALPSYATHAPGGRQLKHPRAATFVWRAAPGRYLLWFHNHAPPAALRQGWDPYSDRNPAWVCAGREIDTPAGRSLAWSEPEILLYDDDPFVRISYPDLLEDRGDFYVTETQKHLGRVHRIDRDFLVGLFSTWDRREVARDGLLLDWMPDTGPRRLPSPRLPPLAVRDTTREDMGRRDPRAGLSIEVSLVAPPRDGPVILLDNRTPDGRGLRLTAEPDGSARLLLSDGRTEASWASDPGLLRPGRPHHLVAVVDGGPRIITFVVDGVLCDGGDARDFGWGRFSPHFRGPAGGPTLAVGEPVRGLRVYGRVLRTYEAVGNCRAATTPR